MSFRNSKLCCALVVAAIFAWMASNVHGQAMRSAVYEEGDFGSWTFGNLSSPGAEAWVTTGAVGTPGNGLAVTTQTGGPAYGIAWADRVWTPAHDGPIVDLSMALDVRSISGWGEGQSVIPVLEQHGQWYAPSQKIITGCSTEWHRLFRGVFTAADFALITSPKWREWDASTNPDFSLDGDPVRFGFMAGNSSSATYTQHYDNWAMEVHTIRAEQSYDLPILNPSFEENSDGSIVIRGWTQGRPGEFAVESENVPFSPPAAHSGSNFATSHIDSGALTEYDWKDRSLMQLVDLSEWASDIDDGFASVNVSTAAWSVSSMMKDKATLSIRFHTDPNGGAAMGDYIATPPLFGPNVTDPDWDELVLDALAVPSGARGLEIRLRTQDGHRSNNSGFDSVAGAITIIPEPCTILLLAGGLALMSGRRKARPR